MTRWHPLLAAEERVPAVWTLTNPAGHDYATIRLERVNGELQYTAQVTQGSQSSHPTVHQSLKAAVEAAHQAWVRGHAPGGAPNGGKGYTLGT